MSEELASRFSELVRRELGATHVVVADAAEPEAPSALVTTLSDGRRVEAHFDGPITDPESTLRRFEILVRAFESVLLEDDPTPKKRAPVAVSLYEELRALSMRCGAVDAIVIDAHSPVVWASATRGTTELEADHSLGPDLGLPDAAKETLRVARESHRGVLIALGKKDSPPEEAFAVVPVDLDTPWDTPAAANEAHVELTARALEAVRKLPQLESLHRGGHLAHTVREDGFGFAVRSFAGIYALVLVFDGPLDDIRVERTLRDALPRIERLVLALPPLDPDPVPAGVVALRPRRRR